MNANTPDPIRAVDLPRIVREFLAWCRRDGFYAFEVSGKTFLLETESDEETIFKAIYASSAAVIRYREAQAMRYLPTLEISH